MARLFALFTLCLLLGFSLPAVAEDQVSQNDLAAHKELMQLKIDGQRELAQKDIDILKTRIDVFDKRIDDLTSHIGGIGMSIDQFTTIVSIALGGLGLLGLFSVAGLAVYQAKKTAVEVAKEASDKWLENNFEEINKKIEGLTLDAVKQYEKTKSDINDYMDKSTQTINGALEAIGIMGDQIRSFGLDVAHQKVVSVPNEHSKELNVVAKEIMGKSVEDYNFSDWNALAFDAYGSGDYKKAADYWRHACIAADASIYDIVNSLYNSAFSLQAIGSTEKAFDIYGELVDKYEDLNISAVQEVIVAAKGNMASILNGRGEAQRADECYQEIKEKYSGGDDSIKQQLSNVLNNKGCANIIKAKAVWPSDKSAALTLLEHARSDLLESLSFNAANIIAGGNYCYVLWLLGKTDVAKEGVAKILSAGHKITEAQYRSTIAAISINKIPEDDGFLSMVDELWREYLRSRCA